MAEEKAETTAEQAETTEASQDAETNGAQRGHDADYLLLRQGVALFLRNLSDEAVRRETRSVAILRESLGHTEWRGLSRDRRIWALGRAAAVPFDKAKALSRKKWKDLPKDVHDAMTKHVTFWIEP